MVQTFQEVLGNVYCTVSTRPVFQHQRLAIQIQSLQLFLFTLPICSEQTKMRKKRSEMAQFYDNF